MKPAQPKTPIAKSEEELLKLWDKEKTFQKSLSQREGQPRFSFYDGPPFANGLPHFGHSLVTSIKDSLGRYKTMQGYYVERRNGWDCHGLPVEFAIEKQLDVSGKKQILDLGLGKFNKACRESVFTYKSEWEDFFGRIGRWTDTKNSYATINRDYTESVWWVMKQVHDKGLLYKGFKSMPYCPRCETPLSNFEVNEGYRDNVADPSLFVKFKLKNEDAYLLAWTTTPWSLPGNAVLAVAPGETYVYVELAKDGNKKETLVLAKKRLEAVLSDEINYKIVKEVSSQELVGKYYEPLFKLDRYKEKLPSDQMYKVYRADFVSVEDGTGVLHVAPAFGEDDLSLGLKYDGIDVLHTVDSAGKVVGGIGFDAAEGKFFKGADRLIIDHLTHNGMVFAAQTKEHTYPFCYRCDSPLLYYAIDTWFIKVSAIRKQLLKTASDINWVPSHIKDGRFGKWLENARDWAVSRNRYWGAPMPVWSAGADDYLVVGSLDELRELAGNDIDLSDLHRPFIDKITFTKDGKTYKRVEEVIDCWFESGSMPVAQQHYPFQNKSKFDDSFPADYIGEGLDQTRLWFYVLHVLSTILFDRPAYKNVIVNGMIMAADGQKLSKRLKNYPPVEDVFATEGADSLRLYLLSNNQAVTGDYMRFNRDGLKDLNRNVVGTLQNSYRFFKMYADIDKWRPKKPGEEPVSTNVLDRWLIARVNQTIAQTTKQADDYKLAHAINPVFELIDDLSNWFIRRSRRRFWKSEDDTDKNQAYEVLYFSLLKVCQLLAPWAPFVSDSLWRDLVPGTKLAKSVHLSDWPEASKPNKKLLEEMQEARNLITEGLSQRSAAKIKVRQPLGELIYWRAKRFSDELENIVAEEVNVKKVTYKNAEGLKVELKTTLTDDLKAEGVMRDLVRHIQSLRKNAGLNVDDRIALFISSENLFIRRVIDMFGEVIKQETLALEFASRQQEHKTRLNINGVEVELSLGKRK